jgi:ribonucleoside-diphosphate reductase alpha chain
MSDPFEHNGIKAHGDICNLGHINLTAYLTKTAQQDFEFDFESFEKDAAILVEALDNIIDISAYPLPELKNAAILRRKIGCGVMGYASLLTMMGYRYNSKEAQEFTNKLLSIYANAVYQKSALLAKEKGKFPLCEIDKMMDNGFIKNSGVLTEETLDLIRKYGLRNSQSLTIAPTGNTSILMGLVSGGLEPVFEREYNRWVEQRTDYSALQGKSYPNLANGEWFDTKDFRKKLWGDEEVLESTWID